VLEPVDEDKPVVLVVDDQTQIRDIFKNYLTPETEVIEAESTATALAAMDDDVDMVVLDRNMAGTSGDDFLDEIRADGFETPVAMVTAVFPGLDIVPMEFDSYLLKPVGRTELRNTVAAVIRRAAVGDPVREYFAILSKVVALESEMQASELDENDDYDELLTELDDIEDEVADELSSMDDGDSAVLVADFSSADDQRIAAVLPD